MYSTQFNTLTDYRGHEPAVVPLSVTDVKSPAPTAVEATCSLSPVREKHGLAPLLLRSRPPACRRQPSLPKAMGCADDWDNSCGGGSGTTVAEKVVEPQLWRVAS